MTKFTLFFDGDDGVCGCLDILNDFSSGSDDGSDKFFGYDHLFDPWYKWFIIVTRFVNGLGHFVEDMYPALTCLFKCLFED